MSDFAKVFTHPDVGQILLTRDYDDEDNSTPYHLTVRFEHSETTVTFALKYRTESTMIRYFGNADETWVHSVVAPTILMLSGES